MKYAKMIIGITGSFGTGKTAVADIFKKHGFEVINADRLYHNIYQKDSALRNKIINEFGTLDRNKIKKIVFNDYKKLKKLNKITHPAIIREIKKEISRVIHDSNKEYSIIKKFNKKSNSIINIKSNKELTIRKNNIGTKNNVKIVLDAPLLIEAKMQDMVDKISVVNCDEKTQIKRLLKKKKYSKKEIGQIIKSQLPIEKKLKYADFVVDNSKTRRETEKQVIHFIASLQKP